jgi:energy-coupling factor transporter ATP-binding protein EcfA2
MEKYNLYKVFTPTTPARLTFVEREKVNTKLVNAIRTPGKQLVVYGPSGSGKTTLLVNKLHQLYETHLTSRCMKGVTFEGLVLDAFDQLSPFYESTSQKTKKDSVSVQFSQDYFAIKNKICGTKTIENGCTIQRVLPPQLTSQALGRFMGEAKCCWVIEDFHKIERNERAKLSQVMKVFMDMADEFSTLKIIALGAVDTARQVVEYDGEMKNRVAEISVPLMGDDEIKEIILKGQKLLNIGIEVGLVNGISSYSNGMASVCHHLCLNLCTSQEIYETTSEKYEMDVNSLQDALIIYLEESSDTLKKAFDSAFKAKRIKKYDNARLIIKAISELPQEGALRSEIYERIKQDERSYPSGNLTVFLNQLCREGESPLIKYDGISGKYSFKDPIYRVFAMVYFERNKPKKYGRSDKLKANTLILKLSSLVEKTINNEAIFDRSSYTISKSYNIIKSDSKDE